MWELVRNETDGQELIAWGTLAEMEISYAEGVEDLQDGEANTYAIQPAI
jgi:hypothetical protein